jgi:hypothetical protein
MVELFSVPFRGLTVWAKDSVPGLPQYVLEARTVAVLIDPEAGVSASDPNANQIAQKDVETALLKWGRFTTVLSPEQADLVIVIRKGSGKLTDATISDPRQNSRPGSVTQTDDGVSVGVQHGPRPPLSTSQQPSRGPHPDSDSTAHPQVEGGSRDDSFLVYQGKAVDPLDGPIAWRWDRKNALHSHDVPAVAEFRKAIEAAEKQAQQNPHQP